MIIDQPGFYFDFPVDAYHADPCVTPSFTQSIAKLLIERSPAHAAAAHPRLTPPEADDEAPESYVVAQAIGNAAHAMLIGRGKTLAVAGFDSWRTKEAKAFKADALDAGRVPILEKHHARAVAMVAAARAQLDAAGWTDVFAAGIGHGEVVVAWQEDGLWFRTMIDWMAEPTRPVDFKSTALSAAPHAVGRLMADAGWDIQAAMHERALDAVDPDNRGRRRHRFVCQENEPPYALTPVELTEATLTIGRKKLDYAIRLWREAMATGAWPGYPPEVVRPEYPAWKESQWLAREVEEAERRPRGGMLPSLMGG